MRNYSIKEIAAVLNVNYMTVYMMIRSEKILAVKVGGQWRITSKELARIQKHGTR